MHKGEDLKISNKILGISLVPIFLLLLGAFVSGISVYSSNQSTQRYINNYAERQYKLYEIFRSMGYGGGIHAFKNYVLRNREEYRISALSNMSKARNLINEYRKFSPLSDEEHEAIEILDQTIQLYLGKLAVIDRMIIEKRSIQEIDKTVKVDDGPAVEALENLQLFFMRMHKIEIEKLQGVNADAFKILVAVFVFALIAAFLMSGIISKSIVSSIKRLIFVSHKIAEGHYDIRHDDVSDLSADEFRDLADQMIDMGENLQFAFDQIKRSNDDLTNFAFIAAHDLQEPIKKVSSYFDLLEINMGHELNSDAQIYVKEIRNSTERMIKLIKALLSYSQVSSTEIETKKVDLQEIVAIAIGNLESLIEETGAQIIAKDLPVVRGNPELLQSLFQNIISNSIKFRKKDSNPIVTISIQKVDRDSWQLNIQDNSMGFDLTYLDVILRPFGRMHSPKDYPGVGIGLPLCKKIVESHGSRFDIDSREQEGVHYSFVLKAD